MSLQLKLEIIQKLQSQYNGSHVGGSIGLFLHGIDLKRDLSHSDIDFFVQKTMVIAPTVGNVEQVSNFDDFDYAYKISLNDNGVPYAKVDVRVSPGSRFETITYNGVAYRVSVKEDILMFKQKYANSGSKKHINDMIVINGGERSVEVVLADDELPF